MHRSVMIINRALHFSLELMVLIKTPGRHPDSSNRTRSIAAFEHRIGSVALGMRSATAG